MRIPQGWGSQDQKLDLEPWGPVKKEGWEPELGEHQRGKSERERVCVCVRLVVATKKNKKIQL